MRASRAPPSRPRAGSNRPLRIASLHVASSSDGSPLVETTSHDDARPDADTTTATPTRPSTPALSAAAGYESCGNHDETSPRAEADLDMSTGGAGSGGTAGPGGSVPVGAKGVGAGETSTSTGGAGVSTRGTGAEGVGDRRSTGALRSGGGGGSTGGGRRLVDVVDGQGLAWGLADDGDGETGKQGGDDTGLHHRDETHRHDPLPPTALLRIGHGDILSPAPP